MKTESFVWADETYTAVYGNKGGVTYVSVIAPSGVEMFTLYDIGVVSVDTLRLCVTTYAIGYRKAEQREPVGF